MSDVQRDIPVTVPLWALAFVLEHANFEDEGPVGQRRESEEMWRAISALDEAVGLQDGRT